MEIILAKQMGWCFGVRRAIKIVTKALKNSVYPVYTLGPLIHNPQEVERLENLGVRSVSRPQSIKKGTLIIRAHGVAPQSVEKFQRKGITITDATCPFVRRTQGLAAQLSKKGYTVIVVGNKSHPEVKSILGYANKKGRAFSAIKDIDKLKVLDKIGVVSQTTQSFSNFQQIVSKLLLKSGELKIYNTICKAVHLRQKAAGKLSEKVNLVLVIGGYNSSNTRALVETCHQFCRKTYHIEAAQELNLSWFRGVKTVGITAGTSTPDWVIKKVIQKLQGIG